MSSFGKLKYHKVGLCALFLSASLAANKDLDLFLALKRKDLSAAEAAIAAGASLNGDGETVATPVIVAISFDFPAGLELLLFHGAEIPLNWNNMRTHLYAEAMGFSGLHMIPENADAPVWVARPPSSAGGAGGAAPRRVVARARTGRSNRSSGRPPRHQGSGRSAGRLTLTSLKAALFVGAASGPRK